MVRSGSAFKVAIVVILLICLPGFGYPQSRQNSGPKLPESRLRVDPADNTVSGITIEDMQKKMNELERKNAEQDNMIAGLVSRVSDLETASNK